MEILKSLLARYWPTASLIIIGLMLIVYVAFGFIYFQQGPEQLALEEKINQFADVIARPLPDVTELQAAYDAVNLALVPMEPKDVIAIIVDIAAKNGIDLSESANNLLIPSAGEAGSAKIGGSTYLVMAFNNIQVQGSHDDVMAFITDLDLGTTMPSMVLTKVIINTDVRIDYTGEDAIRRAEFRSVETAVQEMMANNNLSAIPNPLNFAGNRATNLMGDDPETGETLEGFPDFSTTVAARGYTGNFSPRDGYVIYEHDIISPDEPAEYQTVNYISTLTTIYYYTCEEDGTVRQWDGPSVTVANELIGSEAVRFEIRVILDVDIYTRPPD